MSRATRVLMTVLAACSATALAQTPTDKATPQMKAVLDQLAALNPKPIVDLTPADARKQPSPTDAVVQLMQAKGMLAPDKMPPVGMVETKAVPTANGPVPVRVYTPPGDGPFPVVIYLHGGGWVIATNDTYDASARAICAMSKAVVVSPEYRKAPEHKFPAAHEDCYATLQYVATHGEAFKANVKKIAVFGESAGGNMATGLCRMAIERGGVVPIHQVLIYPVANYAFDTPSYAANADAKPLNKPMMEWFFKQTLNTPADGENPLVSPLRQTNDELKRLPPATVVTAEIDPLHSEGMAYAKKLKDAGVDVEAKDYAGVTHEFFGMAAVVDEAKDAQKFATDRLNAAFAK